MPATFIASLKAFGDFVIASSTWRKVRRWPAHCSSFKVLAAEQQHDLAVALGVEANVILLPTGPGFPAAFDARASGMRRALASVFKLRRAFASVPRDARVIFHELGWREHIICAPRSRTGLPETSNIYSAFAGALRLDGFDLAEDVTAQELEKRVIQPRRVTVFPASRKGPKCIPARTLARVADQLTAAGLRWEIFALETEHLEAPASLPVRRIKANFCSLIEVIRGSDLVLSADSLPAHLAEYYGVPTYVLSPVPNEWWLPLSSHLDGGWSLFDDVEALPAWLAKHVRAPERGEPVDRALLLRPGD